MPNSTCSSEAKAAQSVIRFVPAGLITLRFILGPVLIFVAMQSWSIAVVVVMVTAMLSDIFDGVIARRLKIATERLRVADSWVDAWFFICVGVSAVLTVSSILRAYVLPISIEVVLQIAAYIYDIVRYHRITSIHAYSAKVWAFTLYLATMGLLAFHTGVLIWVAFGFGMISAVDAMAIKLLLPGWQHDVLSTFHALRRRRT
jgi:phosphatidylglycerophosphate synthase